MDQILQSQENLTFTSQALKNRVTSVFSVPHRFIWELPLPQPIRMFWRCQSRGYILAIGDWASLADA